MSKLPTPRGVATLELLIAMALVVVMITSAAQLSFSGQVSGLDTGLTNRGLYDTATQIKDAVALLAANWSVNPIAALDPFYAKTNTVADISPCLKFVGSGSAWSSENNRAQGINFSTFKGSTAAARALGGGCSPFPPGGWDTPGSYGSVDVSGADGTGVAVRSVGGTRYAFVTGDPSAAAKEDFIVVDVSTPTAPLIVAQLNTGKGLNGVVIGGNYAYVIQADAVDQLQVIDISDPDTIDTTDIVGVLTLSNVVPGGSNPEGRSIAYLNNRVYVGTARTAGPEFHVIDVSNPFAPIEIGFLEVDHNVNDIAVAGDYAYLATSADYAELTVINISAPGSMALPPNYTNPMINNQKFNALTTGGGVSDEDGWSVYALGPYVFLGRERVAAATKRDFYILNINNPSSLTAVGSKRLGLGSGPGVRVSALTVQGPLAFLATTDSNDPLFILSVSTPSNPTEVSTCGLNFSQVTRDLVYQDNLLFTANRSNDLLRIMYDTPGVCTP